MRLLVLTIGLLAGMYAAMLVVGDPASAPGPAPAAPGIPPLVVRAPAPLPEAAPVASAAPVPALPASATPPLADPPPDAASEAVAEGGAAAAASGPGAVAPAVQGPSLGPLIAPALTEAGLGVLAAPAATPAATQPAAPQPAGASAASAAGSRLRFVDTTAVNLRAGPSTGFAVLAGLPGGTAVELLDEAQGGWQRVRVAETGVEGWVSARFLRP
jgi:hypothetical protein